MTIGVFDSGVGGLSVARAIQKAFPNCRVNYVNDRKNVPYGTKTPAELLRLVTPILQALAARSDIIVIACNTVTTNLIAELRTIIKVPLVGIEPMVKPASAITKSGVIAVCATSATLASGRYQWLKDTYASGIKVLEPDCSDWAYMIEHNQIDKQKIEKRIEEVLAKGADVIVLGCTHYHWIQELIKAMAGAKAIVLQPESAIVERLRQLVKERSLPL